MMLNAAHLGTRRQQVFQMAAPARRILALAIAARGRPVEDAFYPAAHPARGFWLLRPYRLDRLQHEPDIDDLHGKIAEHRIDIAFEGRAPLRGVLGVAPARLMGADVSLGAVLEVIRLRRIEP